jgi:hypothetical protein
LSHDHLIFVDEAGVNTAMTRRCARAPRAERAHESAPRNYAEQTSLISALGLRRGLLATITVQGAVDTLCFDAYVERVLCPQLRRGAVVVLDNLGRTKRVALNK